MSKLSKKLAQLVALCLSDKSSSVIRSAAANQFGYHFIGELNDSNEVLKAVLKLLHSENWDIRIAGGVAFESVLAYIDEAYLECALVDFEKCHSGAEKFILSNVLASHKFLEAKPDEFDNVQACSSSEQKKQLCRQFKLHSDLDEEADFIDESDFRSHDVRAKVKHTVTAPYHVELNRSIHGSSPDIEKMQAKTENVNKIEHKPEVIKTNALTDLLTGLMDGAINPYWYKRHGSLIGVRAFFKFLAKKINDTNKFDCSVTYNEFTNIIFKVGLLDRFSDFVSDETVFPVREIAAQSFANIAQSLSHDKRTLMIKRIIEYLQYQNNWDIQCSGLLFLKYSIPLFDDCLLLHEIFTSFSSLLYSTKVHERDDLITLALSILLMMKQKVHEWLLKTNQLNEFSEMLWDLFAKIDDLSPASGYLIDIISYLITENKGSTIHFSLENRKIVMKCCSLLHHHITSVRIAAINSIKCIVELDSSTKTWSHPVLVSTFRYLFQLALYDANENIRCEVESLWNTLITEVKPLDVYNSTENWLEAFLFLMMHSYQAPLDSKYLLSDKTDELKSFDAMATPSQRKQIRGKDNNSSFGNAIFGIDANDCSAATSISTGNRKRIGDALSSNNKLLQTPESKRQKRPIMSDTPWATSEDDNAQKTSRPSKRPGDSVLSTPWATIQNSKQLRTDESKSVVRDSVSQSKVNDVNVKSRIVGGIDTLSMTAEEIDRRDFNTRIVLARMLAKLFGAILVLRNSNAETSFIELILFHMERKSAIGRICAALLIYEIVSLSFSDTDENYLVLAKSQRNVTIFRSPSYQSKFWKLLTDSVLFDEAFPLLTKANQTAKEIILFLRQHQLSDKISPSYKGSLPLGDLEGLIDELGGLLDKLPSATSDVNVKESLSHRLDTLRDEHGKAQLVFSQCRNRTFSLISSVVIQIGILPQKLNPILQPILDTIAIEENHQLLHIVCTSLAKLMVQSVDRRPCPNLKILNKILTNAQVLKIDDRITDEPSLTLTDYPGLRQKALHISKTDNSDSQLIGSVIALKSIVREFGENLPDKFADFWCKILIDDANTTEKGKLSQNLHLFDILISDIESIIDARSNETTVQQQVSILLKLVKTDNSSLIRFLAGRCLLKLLTLKEVISFKVLNRMIREFNDWLSIEKNEQEIHTPVGILETIHGLFFKTPCSQPLSDSLQLSLVGILMPLILRYIAHPDSASRKLAIFIFTNLVQLSPAIKEISCPSTDSNDKSKDYQWMSDDLLALHTRRIEFIRDFTESTSRPKIPLSFKLNIDLRPYQWEAINWLWFLHENGLNGALCDDMGLGKSIQALCTIFTSITHGTTWNQHSSGKKFVRQSLIICPSSLTGHWRAEIAKFFSSNDQIHFLNTSRTPLPLTQTNQIDNDTPPRLNILEYAGNLTTRRVLQSLIATANLIITSYDNVRRETEIFNAINWDYCVLDEGHLIQNFRSKLSEAVRSIKATHRLILTGTPIQSSPLDLWSLFDFLMPEYLGSRAEFQSSICRPVRQSRSCKATKEQMNAGSAALNRLHKTTLPFIMRRLKEDVLKSLPPKIIQDRFCELFDIQRQLYDRVNLAKIEKIPTLGEKDDEDFEKNKKQKSSDQIHIFQVLSYLRKICSHPLLITSSSGKITSENISSVAHDIFQVADGGKSDNQVIESYRSSGKFVALKQLLKECGLGYSEVTDVENGSEVHENENLSLNSPPNTDSALSSFDNLKTGEEPHRVIIFAQFKSTLDLIERFLIRPEFPSIEFLRLDGSVPSEDRSSIAQRFNSDKSISILLATVNVAGLGLNLTGGDVVIFVEHDWNPMRDMQAMDRAHRLGQNRVVNVYRLITRDSLEEKIMNLQKFKLHIAETVVNDDNKSFETLSTNELLDLLALREKEGKLCNEKTGDNVEDMEGEGGTKRKGKPSMGLANFLDSLGDLWNEEEYEKEHNLDNFIEKYLK